jgi:hypothetical protein
MDGPASTRRSRWRASTTRCGFIAARARRLAALHADSPNAIGSRGFARGTLYARDGTLVASTAQEGLVRLRKSLENRQNRIFCLILGRMIAAGANAFCAPGQSRLFTSVNAPARRTGTSLDSPLHSPAVSGSRRRPANAGDPQQRRVKPDENRDGNHQAVQARRGARSAHRRRDTGADRHRSQRLRTAEGAYGNLSRRRIRRELPAQDQDRNRSADELVDKAVEAISGAAKTGQIGDGKVFVYGLDQAVRIRTGETDADAL